MMRHRRKHTPAELALTSSSSRDVTTPAANTSDTEMDTASPLPPLTSSLDDTSALTHAQMAAGATSGSSLTEVLESSNVLRNLFGFDKTQLEQMVCAAGKK